MTRSVLSVAIAAVTASGLVACGSDDDNSSPSESAYQPYKIGLLPDTQGGSDSEGQSHVAMHPMREVLSHQADAGVDMVIALGDLTDKGTTVEWAEWTSVAESYKDQGIEFLPVMGNHETSYAYTVEWIKTMRDYIPEDAVHMPGFEWINYYVIRENVLIVGLAYYNLPIAFSWIQDVIESNEDQVDHIVVASHDGLVGAKYGQTREQIVEGTKDDDWVYSVQEDIRDYFSQHDVIYVQGHEHQYQRSLITAQTALTTTSSGSTPEGGNYRMNAYTQIMAGNASYKGYEYRYGERELIQMVISQKNNTLSNGATGFDVNSSWLAFDNDRVDYQSYYSEHTASSNDADQAFSADWKMLDGFSRTTNRCDNVIYPTSVPEDTRPVLVFQTDYLSDICIADDGTVAQLIGGSNDTFNRTDTRTRDMEYTPGFSRAETLMDLTRLAYQWMYVYHESWTPNLNSAARAIPDEEENLLLIPGTTIDLKEHVTLSWTEKTSDTRSDILIVSGTQNQTGIYQSAYGAEKDIEADAGLDLSSPSGAAKSAVVLPATATQSWDMGTAVADSYGVAMTATDSLSGDDVVLASKTDTGWEALTSADCIYQGLWLESYAVTAPARDAACSGEPLVGYDADGNQWWTVLNSDAELALVSR
ncbi:metallophosphoesterase [Oceanobacter sp. 4_MG-2023]|nr:metallophosphoesterase [Oceanobacter sp. 4_MG-2023]